MSGLASGFDWLSVVEQLTEVERAPQRRLRSEQSRLSERNTAYGNLVAALESLQEKIKLLQTSAFFESRITSLSDDTIATAGAGAGVALGRYNFNIQQLATASIQQGGADVANPLHDKDNVSNLVLSGAAFARPVTAGTFTVNGQVISIDPSETLKNVFDKISTATGGKVTGSYDSKTDKITLSSAKEIVLGSAADTSNFLQVAQLSNNGTKTITSTYTLGTASLSAALKDARLRTTVSDGGAGQGEFKINGISIKFNASTDTITDVVARINNSNAGVSARYDAYNDRFVLTNQKTGDLGVALQDVSGNFLKATGLSDGTLIRGQNLLYTVNGGPVLSSASNTISEESSNIAGLSVTALTTGAVTVEVLSDTGKIKNAITEFVDEYNKVQSLIDTQTAINTDEKGNLTTGVLANEREAEEVARQLRLLANTTVSSLSGAMQRLASLGIHSNGNDNNLTISEGDTLENALGTHLLAIKDLFANETQGLAARLGDYLERIVGEQGALLNRQDTLSKQITGIDKQIEDLERIVLANRQRLIDSFIAMEKAQASLTQQLQFLLQRFGSE